MRTNSFCWFLPKASQTYKDNRFLQHFFPYFLLWLYSHKFVRFDGFTCKMAQPIGSDWPANVFTIMSSKRRCPFPEDLSLPEDEDLWKTCVQNARKVCTNRFEHIMADASKRYKRALAKRGATDALQPSAPSTTSAQLHPQPSPSSTAGPSTATDPQAASQQMSQTPTNDAVDATLRPTMAPTVVKAAQLRQLKAFVSQPANLLELRGRSGETLKEKLRPSSVHERPWYDFLYDNVFTEEEQSFIDDMCAVVTADLSVAKLPVASFSLVGVGGDRCATLPHTSTAQYEDPQDYEVTILTKDVTACALVIKERWCDRIFDNNKVWELRGTECVKHLNERIFIAQSGSSRLVGEVTIINSFCVGICDENGQYQPLPQPENFFLDPGNMAKHQVADVSEVQYRKVYAWVLHAAMRYEAQTPYIHQIGQVGWVTLQPAVAAKARKYGCRIVDGRDLVNTDDVRECCPGLALANIRLPPLSRSYEEVPQHSNGLFVVLRAGPCLILYFRGDVVKLASGDVFRVTPGDRYCIANVGLETAWLKMVWSRKVLVEEVDGEGCAAAAFSDVQA